MKRLLFVLTSALLAFFFTTSVAQAAPTINPNAAPTGTHLQTASIGCSLANGVVTCSSYELAGVGNANATATLNSNYTATVRCRNHGGQIVDVKSQVRAVPATTGNLSPKNGRLFVPSLTSSAPTAGQFEALAVCPNGNWTKETLTSTIALGTFTYTLRFAGFTGNYITITGP